jgi:hypothetical protein
VSSTGIQQILTATVEVELHKSDRRMNTIVVWIFVSELADPGKVRLAKMGLEGPNTVFEDTVRIVFVERFEQTDDVLLLFWREQ